MLPEFKKRIDTLRDILVGAVPSPAGQIEQITYALLYKFMSDIDDRAASLPGGKRTYFTGEYKKYSWHELLAPTLGAHDRLTLYREALSSLAQNAGLPELFQGIYQNAYLPFNDPRVLTLFLKEIDNFKHSNSDDIGDAYEYLLQITGAQGDVGQFRTPRHIIKFIVEAINPTKNDSVLDPAVGTAGFLIAAYNHVKHHHDGVDDITGLPTDTEKRLTSDELDKLHKNYHGFDIDPTMVRTAKVNMYLHGFKTPDIKNHDSLSSEDYWNERYDVILANPPFMSPKGGIKPHDKFGIVANRAEVLFVDYIASHLKPTGRAGIVVPEGIIFQSGKAYKELRKNLVENYLYTVVSLPAGVFQPYSGVKTSILLLDKELAKQQEEILFIKIENDGFSLGAQRREIAGNQFPKALRFIEHFRTNKEIDSEFAHTVPRKRIAEGGDYNLSGDRYKAETLRDDYEYPLVELGNLVTITGGSTPLKSNENFWKNGTVPWFTVEDIRQNGRLVRTTQKHITNEALRETSIKIVPENSVLLCCTASIGEYAFTTIPLTTNQQFNALTVKDNEQLLPRFLYWVISDFKHKLEKMAGKTSFSFVSAGTLKNIKIPLPSIEIQQEIIIELDNYQKMIDAAQIVAKAYKPQIKISPDWNNKRIGDIARVINGRAYNKEELLEDGKYPVLRVGNFFSNRDWYYSNLELDDDKYCDNGDLLYAWSASFGPRIWTQSKAIFHYHIWKIIPVDTVLRTYLNYILYLKTDEIKKEGGRGLAMVHLTKQGFENTLVPIPSLQEQERIVAQLEDEQKLVDANKKLVEIFQQKIKDKIAEVWGE
jgi:type I restriction enzyme M protein